MMMMMMAVAWTSFLLCYKPPSASSDGTYSNASLSYCPSGSRANRYYHDAVRRHRHYHDACSYDTFLLLLLPRCLIPSERGPGRRCRSQQWSGRRASSQCSICRTSCRYAAAAACSAVLPIITLPCLSLHVCLSTCHIVYLSYCLSASIHA